MISTHKIYDFYIFFCWPKLIYQYRFIAICKLVIGKLAIWVLLLNTWISSTEVYKVFSFLRTWKRVKSFLPIVVIFGKKTHEYSQYLLKYYQNKLLIFQAVISIIGSMKMHRMKCKEYNTWNMMYEIVSIEYNM